MIIDKTENLRFYSAMLPALSDALSTVLALNKYEPGRYPLSDGAFYMIQKGTTKLMSADDYEAHRAYIDVQLVIEGSEEIAWSDISDLKEVSYDPEKDKAVLSGPADHTIKITPGMAWIAFPHDGHKAIRHTKGAMTYTKIVIKLPAQQVV